MYKTDNCCYCVGLRTGSLLIGWLQLTFCLFNVMGGIFFIISEYPLQDGFVLISPSNDYLFWSDIVTSLSSFVIAACLIHGIYMNQKRYIHFYLYAGAVFLVVKIIVVVIAVIMGTYVQVVASIFANMINWVISAYLLIVVYSYHEELAG